jgi:hypothetical protein
MAGVCGICLCARVLRARLIRESHVVTVPCYVGGCAFGCGRDRRLRFSYLCPFGDWLMAMTRERELRLERANLVVYFTANQAAWQAVAQDAYEYTKKQFGDAPVRQDDLAKPLRLVVEIHKGLRDTLDQKRLSQNYWIDFFASLVIDRTWDALNK